MDPGTKEKGPGALIARENISEEAGEISPHNSELKAGLVAASVAQGCHVRVLRQVGLQVEPHCPATILCDGTEGKCEGRALI